MHSKLIRAGYERERVSSEPECLSKAVVVVEEREVEGQRRTRGAFIDKRSVSRDRVAFV